MLLILAIVAGFLTTLVIRWTTSPRPLRDTRNRIYAHLLEFRLFFDEPALIWRAQLELLRDNARLVRLLLPATLVLALPMTWLFLQLEVWYGLRPLHPGEAALITAQLSRPIEPTDRFELQGAPGIAVESPPVRIWRDNQVSWRVRPQSETCGALKLTINGQLITKTIVSGGASQLLSPRRYRAPVKFLQHPQEPRLSGQDVEWLDVNYPAAGNAWLAWFVAVSTATAITSAHWINRTGR